MGDNRCQGFRWDSIQHRYFFKLKNTPIDNKNEKKPFLFICSLLLVAGCNPFDEAKSEKIESIQIEKPNQSSDSSSSENNNTQADTNNQTTTESLTNQNNSLANNAETAKTENPSFVQPNPNNQPVNLNQSPPANQQLPTSNQPLSIQFKAHDFDKEGTGYIPPRLPNGGAWVYTKESHPNNITREFNWDLNDVIHVQLNDPKYKGYTPEPARIELVGGPSPFLRVIFEMKKYTFYSQYNLAPRRYIEVPRGSIPINTPVYLYSTSGEQLY